MPMPATGGYARVAQNLGPIMTVRPERRLCSRQFHRSATLVAAAASPGRDTDAEGDGEVLRSPKGLCARRSHRAATDVRLCGAAFDQVTETNPRLAVPAHQLHGVNRPMVGRAGVDFDAREYRWIFDVMQAFRLLH